MAKMGRPLKSKTALSHDVKIRLDDEMFEQLCAYCESTGSERAAVIREAIQLYLDIVKKHAE